MNLFFLIKLKAFKEREREREREREKEKQRSFFKKIVNKDTDVNSKLMGETTILKLPLCVNLQGNYIYIYIYMRKYIFKHHKHKTHTFQVENLLGVRRKKPPDRSPLKQFHHQQLREYMILL
jgi:GT2 family glycosyltransferase